MFEYIPINEILLRRKNKLTIQKNPEAGELRDYEKTMIASIMKNIESLGFTFSEDIINVLTTYTREDLELFYKDLIPKLRKLKGADVEYYPMYPNFPEQVMEASDIELFFNAMIHYMTSGVVMPGYEKDERMPLIHADKMTVLSLGEVTDIFGIFQNILCSKTSISPQDRDDVEKIVEEFANFYDYLPDELPMKENAAIVAKIITDKAAIKNAARIKKYFKTATDVLRYVVAISDGDISLAESTKYKHMRRCERRMVMDLLAGCGNILEDMYRYQYEWIRIGEIIHPGTYQYRKYRRVRRAFNHLRNEHKPLFMPGKIHAAIIERDFDLAVSLLKQRPGEMARKLDKLIRDSKNKQIVIDSFSEVANKVSTSVLLQVRQHFMRRNDESPIRVFFPKGKLANVAYIKNELPHIESKYCDKVIDVCEKSLIDQYKTKVPMGNVYIDEELKNYIAPFSQRSASKANKIIVRGSSLPVGDDVNIIRSFIWWTNMSKYERTDIDLSATAYNSEWGYIDHISYTNLGSQDLNAYHSGDIVNGGDPDGNGVAEFIDIDIDRAARVGVRYIVFQVFNYTDHHYSKMENCRFGWMQRHDMASGEIFEPRTVDTCMDLTADSCIAVPVILDCVDRKFIWCDMVLADRCVARSRGGNNLESNLSNITATCYAMVNMNKTNMYDLAMLNAKARGEIVDSRELADVIFSNDTSKPVVEMSVIDPVNGDCCAIVAEKDVEIITAFDIDYFMGNLL